MIEVEFLEKVFLPRFTFNEGELWAVRKEKVTEEGFHAGGGFVKKNQYKIIRES